MSGVEKAEQIRALAARLKPIGFKRRGATWHRATDETIQVVNVQGSQWGPEYYLNIGTYLRALGAEATPPESRCHVRARIESPDQDVDRLVHACSAWFERFGTVHGLLASGRDGTLPAATTAEAKAWLNTA